MRDIQVICRRNVLGRRSFPTVEWVISWMESLCSTCVKHNHSVTTFTDCTKTHEYSYCEKKLARLICSTLASSYQTCCQRYNDCQQQISTVALCLQQLTTLVGWRRSSFVNNSCGLTQCRTRERINIWK